MPNNMTNLEQLEKDREIFFKGITNGISARWRVRMKANYWVTCRLIKAHRLGIPYAQLPYEDDGDLSPNDTQTR